jgi:hypothetical protein
MVNNFTNINKTSNHLSLNTKKTTPYDVGNPGPGKCFCIKQSSTYGWDKVDGEFWLRTGQRQIFHIQDDNKFNNF